MSISEKLERRVGPRPRGVHTPDQEQPGYSQPDAIDPSGYALADAATLGRGDGAIGDGEISDVSPPRLSPVVGRRSDASYGDDTVHPVPGGALGEAGACWEDQDFGPAVGLTGQHAIRRVNRDEADGIVAQHAWRPVPSVYAGYSHGGEHASQTPARSAARLTDAPLEYTADRDTKPRSDSEVYRDVYGPRMPEGGEDPGAD